MLEENYQKKRRCILGPVFGTLGGLVYGSVGSVIGALAIISEYKNPLAFLLYPSSITLYLICSSIEKSRDLSQIDYDILIPLNSLVWGFVLGCFGYGIQKGIRTLREKPGKLEKEVERGKS